MRIIKLNKRGQELEDVLKVILTHKLIIFLFSCILVPYSGTNSFGKKRAIAIFTIGNKSNPSLSKNNFSRRANIMDTTLGFFRTLLYQSIHVQTADVTVVKHVDRHMMFINPKESIE